MQFSLLAAFTEIFENTKNAVKFQAKLSKIRTEQKRYQVDKNLLQKL